MSSKGKKRIQAALMEHIMHGSRKNWYELNRNTPYFDDLQELVEMGLATSEDGTNGKVVYQLTQKGKDTLKASYKN